jgi:hypothetical protein
LPYEDSQNCCTDGELSPSADSSGEVGGGSIFAGADKGAMVRAARCLLAAVTQVLLLADTVVVKQLLQAKDKVKFILINHSASLFYFILISNIKFLL